MLFNVLHRISVEPPSCSALEQRPRETLTRLRVGSGDGVLLTLLCRLTLGVVVVELTAGFSSLKTALRYPASSLSTSADLRELLPLEKFQMENFLSDSKSVPRPNNRKARLIAFESLNRLET